MPVNLQDNAAARNNRTAPVEMRKKVDRAIHWAYSTCGGEHRYCVRETSSTGSTGALTGGSGGAKPVVATVRARTVTRAVNPGFFW